MPAKKPIAYRRISIASIQKDFATIFLPVARQIGGMVARVADRDGKLNLSRDQRESLLRQVDTLVLEIFVDPQTRNAFGRDGVTALKPYGQKLNEWYVKVVYDSVKVHYDWMTRNVPADVQRWLKTRGRRSRGVGELVNPFLRGDDESIDAYKRRLQQLRLFDPNPLAQYDPMHTWVDPNGYELSGRIWNTANNTRDKIHRIIDEAIRRGDSATNLAKLVEQFLVPGRASLRTRKPYGSDASFDAMRLARSEIARAANWAAHLSALSNPYVDRVDVARSANGDPTCKICPTHATIGIDGRRIRDPYPVRDAIVPIYHPNCMCREESLVGQTKGEITEQLRAIMQDARQELLVPNLTPLSLDTFLLDIMGQQLMQLLAQVVQLPLPL
jgi:hypothetical protein